MGDRGNIFFVDHETDDGQLAGLYMYGHWSGAFLPEVVMRALDRGRGRWGDSQYLARIVFCELVRDDLDGTTGFGLSTSIGDNEHAIVRVNDLDQTVAFCPSGSEADPAAKPTQSWSYEEFAGGVDFWDAWE